MKYEKGKIYKLVDNTNGNIYIGSTIQLLSKRKHEHSNLKKNSCVSKLIIDNGDYDIILIENYPCNSKEELLARERYFIENMECININIPGRTNKEWYNNNKERILKKKKEWYYDNIEHNKKYNKEYYKINKEYYKIYREKNKEKFKEYCKNNKDKQKEYYNNNKNKIINKYYYEKSWGGYKRTENNLLKISMDIFE
jgi:hypothetical protein